MRLPCRFPPSAKNRIPTTVLEIRLNDTGPPPSNAIPALLNRTSLDDSTAGLPTLAMPKSALLTPFPLTTPPAPVTAMPISPLGTFTVLPWTRTQNVGAFPLSAIKTPTLLTSCTLLSPTSTDWLETPSFSAHIPAPHPEFICPLARARLTVPAEPGASKIPATPVPPAHPASLPVPSTLRLIRFTGPGVWTSTCAATPSPKMLVTFWLSPPPGTTIAASSCPALAMPTSVTGCEIITCSGYVPGHTRMVEPAGTLLTAAEIVGKLVNRGLQDPTA